MQKKIVSQYCRLCGSKHLAFILGKTAANSYGKINLSKKLKKYPLGLNLCNTCGHLQLTHSVKPEKCLAIIFIKLILLIKITYILKLYNK